jgi:glutathione S-transferase
MALSYAGISTEQHEVDLKNKPIELIKISPKATVPVLVLENGQIIDQSLDIIKWALSLSDPEGWMKKELEEKSDALIHFNDHDFKPILDNYKYPQKTDRPDPVYYREQAKHYLEQLNTVLMQHKYLLADHITFADIAIFPFIRQFYKVDERWFLESDYKFLIRWLNNFLNSALFLGVMTKKHTPPENILT